MSEYDISSAFEEIEAALIRSMARNFKGHRDWELSEGFDWPMWQAEQLKALERYRREARKAMGSHSANTDRLIDQLLETTFQDAAAAQERDILRAIRRGARIPRTSRHGEDTDAFFRTNARKLDALREAVKNDLHTAETSTLRMAEDVYRKTIFNAQVYANSGAGTLWQAVDMATRSFLAAGLGAVRYRDGRQVNAASYAEMAVRTANKRAYLTGEGAMRQEWGVSLVIVTRRGTGCPYCVQWQGRVYVDDVWSGGRPDGQHPFLSTAIAGGLYHPNCKDSHTTYFPGVSSEPTPPTAEQRERMVENYNLQQKQRYYERQVRKYKRLEAGSLDPDNTEKYKARRQEWQARARELVQDNPDVLRREYAREKVRAPRLKYGYEQRVVNAVEIAPKRATMDSSTRKGGGTDVHYVTRLDVDKYRCVSKEIATDEVIITDERIQHIKDRHPKDFERYERYLAAIIQDPDYILEANKPSTAFLLKEIEESGERFQLILRLAVQGDVPGHKNSVITFLKVEEKRYKRYLRTKNILYKAE